MGAFYQVLSCGNEKQETPCGAALTKAVTRDVNFETLLANAAGILKCDMDLYRDSARISKSSKADRDLLIYIAYQLGAATNQQIREKFGLTYSSVSQRVRVLKENLKKIKRRQESTAILNH